MLGSPTGPGGPTGQRSLWPLAPVPAPSAASFTSDGILSAFSIRHIFSSIFLHHIGFSKCGVYSLFPGGPTFGSALYSHASTVERFAASHIQQTPVGNPFHASSHKGGF